MRFMSKHIRVQHHALFKSNGTKEKYLPPDCHCIHNPIRSQVSLDFEMLNCCCIFSGSGAISKRKFAKKRE